MSGPDSARSARPSAVPRLLFLSLVAIAVAGAVAAYGQTIGGELAYDDYFLTRPWRTIELERVWHSTWDPTRISVAFYRPITAWFYAIRFEVFGLNGVPQHALSLIMFATSALLAGLFVWREVASARAAMLTTLAYAIHPSMAYAQAAWLTNQMHLLASLITLSALIGWQWARSRGSAAWLVVFALQCVAFGVKEDTVMIAPAILGLTALRWLMLRDLRWPHWTTVGILTALPFGLFWFRYQALGRLGGYGGWPGIEGAWRNYSSALGIFTLRPVRRPWQAMASIASQALLVGGAVAASFRRESLYLLLAGLWTAAIFNLPFVLVSKAEQAHLIVFGATVALGAAGAALLERTPVRVGRTVVSFVVVASLLTFVPLSRHIARDYAPCSPITLGTDGIVQGWAVVPPEIQAWLAEKPARCASGTLQKLTRSVSTATWAFWPELGEDGRGLQWTGPQATVLARRSARRLRVELRRPTASPAAPVDVVLTGPAGVERQRLTDGDWHTVSVPLAPGFASWLSDMHRVELSATPTFVPVLLDRRNPDNRRLGVQIRTTVEE